MKTNEDMYELRIDPKTNEVMMTLSELARNQARHFHDGIHLGYDIKGLSNPFEKLLSELSVDEFAEFFSLGLQARLNKKNDPIDINVAMLQWLTSQLPYPKGEGLWV